MPSLTHTHTHTHTHTQSETHIFIPLEDHEPTAVLFFFAMPLHNAVDVCFVNKTVFSCIRVFLLFCLAVKRLLQKLDTGVCSLQWIGEQSRFSLSLLILSLYYVHGKPWLLILSVLINL